MILHDPVLNKRCQHRYAEKIAILKEIVDDVVEDSRIFLTHVQSRMTVDSVTPLQLHGAYQAMATYGALVSDSNSRDAEALEILEQKLIVVGHRWNAGGTSYLSPIYRDQR
jgi:hypothetical protein